MISCTIMSSPSAPTDVLMDARPDRNERTEKNLAAPVRRWALLIGINKYLNLPGKDLKGCVNDVEQMKRTLIERFEFTEGQIELLRNEDATRDNMLQALDRLVERTEKNELVFFQFAGHGSRMTDREGNKPSRFDETIVPYDSGRRPKPNRDITDDELAVRLTRLAAKTPHIVLLFDCCHSATAFRDGFGNGVRSIEPDTRSISELPDSPMDADDLVTRGSRGGVGLMSLSSDRYVAISGCRDEERSHEHAFKDGEHTRYHGALTFFVLRALAQASGRVTYQDLYERVSPAVTARYPLQHPQLEGARDRVLFSMEQIPSALLVYAEWAGGPVVTLTTGAVQGTVAGSVWALHKLETKTVTADTPALARVEVSRVAATHSQAPLPASNLVLPKRARAVEVERPFSRQWPIELACPPNTLAGSALAAQIRNSLWLRAAGEGDSPLARIYLAPPRSESSQPVPQIARLAEPSWLVVRQDGELIMPPLTVGKSALVRTNLEKWARYSQALELNNPISRYAGKVRLTILVLDSAGGWQRSTRELFEGERFAIEVRQDHDEPVYVALLAFNMDRSISPIYPPPGGYQRLAPGDKPLTLGLDGDRRLTANFPADLGLVPRVGLDAITSGTDYVKLFVTSEPVDFAPLWQSSLQGRLMDYKGADTPLGKLLQLCAGTSKLATRSIDMTTPAREADWYSEVGEILVKRRPAT